MAELRKYGVQTTLSFPLIDRGQADYEVTPVVHAAGDTEIDKDEAGFGNTTNAFAHRGGGIYSIVLTAAEMQAARIIVKIIDQTAPKEWEDQAVSINTYGHPSAQHAFDLDSPTVSAGGANLYVTKAGNDANDGLSWPQAKLTVGATVTAASDGDTLHFGPGSFAEAVACGGKQLHFLGSGRDTTTITQSGTAHTISGLGAGSSIRSLRVVDGYSAGAGGAISIGSGSDDVVVEDVLLEAERYGISIYEGECARFRNLVIRAKQAGISCIGAAKAESFVLEDSVLVVAGYSGTEAYGVDGDGDNLIQRCVMYVDLDNASGTSRATGIRGRGGYHMMVRDCHIKVSGADQADASGVRGYGSSHITVLNSTVKTISANGDAFDFDMNVGGYTGRCVVGNTDYDPTKVSGTIVVIEGALIDDAISSSKVATDAIDAAALKTDAVTEIRDAITGGAYALDTDANGRIRIVDGAGAGELNTASGKVDVNDKTGFSLSSPQTFNLTGNITGNLSGSVGTVSGAVGSVTGTIGGLTAAALKDFFDTDSGSNFAGAVSGSVVKEIATSPTGSGSITFTVTVNVGGSPIAGVEVWITTDAPGSNVIAGALTTNGSGQAVFYLDNGSYYLWKQLRGYDFTNPEAIVVS